MAATIAPNGTLRAREPRAYTLVLRGRSPGHCLPKAPWGRHGGAFSAVGTPRTRCDHGSHVVVVNFWTLTCINWLRQEPYVRAWSQAYRNDGLVVIGVHTPEFSFEHDISDHHFGERQYEQSERVIQRLLGVERELVVVEGLGVEAAADWDHLGTPETYLGYARGDRFASPNGAALGESRAYQLVREHDGVHERTLEITFREPGAEAYAFTFG